MWILIVPYPKVVGSNTALRWRCKDTGKCWRWCRHLEISSFSFRGEKFAGFSVNIEMPLPIVCQFFGNSPRRRSLAGKSSWYLQTVVSGLSSLHRLSDVTGSLHRLLRCNMLSLTLTSYSHGASDAASRLEAFQPVQEMRFNPCRSCVSASSLLTQCVSWRPCLWMGLLVRVSESKENVIKCLWNETLERSKRVQRRESFGTQCSEYRSQNCES